MSDTANDTNNPAWLSTYGILTAERILERFQISLSRDELLQNLKNPESPYHHLLTVPLKNLFNGIMMKQVHDYQVYTQKLFIDYKLTVVKVVDENGNEPASSSSEEALEIKYSELMQLGKLFEEKQHAHQQLIAKSQRWLMQQTHKTVFEANTEALNQIQDFGVETEALMLMFQNLRNQFRELIIQTSEILNLMSDYKPDLEQMAENKEALDFNPELINSEVLE